MRKKLYSIRNSIKNNINYIIYRKHIPIFYFSKKKNVGDILNPYLIEKISNNKTFLVKSRNKKHILPIGSILHFATKQSIVWGSGIIHPSQLPSEETLGLMDYRAVRGELTKQELERHNLDIKNIALGDPGILLPLFYTPKKSNKRFRVGIVPHYVDANNPTLLKYLNKEDVLIIDVQQDPEEFIDQITSCDYILSSSLHGLILSDAYEVPNAWLRFSDKMIGGNFKFHDYYTTTDKMNVCITGPACIYNQNILDDIISRPENFCEVNHYIYDKQTLLASFPGFL